MPNNPRMTLDEVATDMRSFGMSISKDILSHCLEQGVFPFGHVVGVSPTGARCFMIMRKDYEDWAQAYLVPYANS